MQRTLLQPVVDVIGDGVRLLSSAGAELVLHLPLTANPKLVQLFEMLEQGKASFGIQNYGLAVTSMEDVFLKIADQPDVCKEPDTDDQKPDVAVPVGTEEEDSKSVVSVSCATHTSDRLQESQVLPERL